MKTAKGFFVLMLVSIMLLSGCSNTLKTPARELTISAAASLQEPIQEIARQYENTAHIKININLGSSGALQKQIEQGAPVDLMISAGKSQVNALVEEGLADKGTYREILANSLVLIVSNSYDKNIKSMEDLKVKAIKLALGEISTVPAGQYSKEFLESLKLWDSFKDRIVYARDVKAVLNYVELGDVQAGLVYKSDAVNLKNSYIAYSIPSDTHEPIVYPAVVIKRSNNKALAMDFIDFLGKAEAKKVFEKYNFSVKDN